LRQQASTLWTTGVRPRTAEMAVALVVRLVLWDAAWRKKVNAFYRALAPHSLKAEQTPFA
jgi:hypothetical protein